jgi:hypothetical protein
MAQSLSSVLWSSGSVNSTCNHMRLGLSTSSKKHLRLVNAYGVGVPSLFMEGMNIGNPAGWWVSESSDSPHTYHLNSWRYVSTIYIRPYSGDISAEI